MFAAAIRKANPMRCSSGSGELGVEPQRAAREAVRVEDAHQQGRVRHRRPGAAAGVARRPGVGARARRADDDVARGRDRDDAASARADAGDLGRERVDDQVVLQLEGVVDERRSVDDQRDVRGGPADVAADEVALAERLAEAPAGHRPGGRAGEDDPERLLQRLLPGQERRGAVGEVQLAGEARIPEPAVEGVRVAGEDQLHDHVDQRGRRTRVLLRERRGLRGDRDRDVLPELLAHQLAEPPLVHRVDVCVQQADCDALDPAAPQHFELAPRLLLVERDEDASVGEQAFGDPAPEVARDERPGHVAERPAPRRVALPRRRPPDPAAVEDVAVALRRQERDLRQRAGDHRVQSHRAGVVEDGRANDAEPLRALDHGSRRIGRAARHLRHLDLPVADRDDVCERPSDVDAEH
jgi:hypothetical protein